MAAARARAGQSLGSVVVFVVDPRESLGFDIAVGLLVRRGRPREEAEKSVREQRAKMLAATGIAASAGLLSLAEASALLSEVGTRPSLEGAQAFVDGVLAEGDVRMIAARDTEWHLELVRWFP
jgi:hypothetical protein